MTTETPIGPAAAEFPITWDDPTHADQPWFQDVMHNPLPVSPLNATLYQRAFEEGASRAIARLSMPIAGINVTVQNSYVYLGERHVVATPDEMEARFAEMQRITMELCPTILQDWRETFEPDVLRRDQEDPRFRLCGGVRAGTRRGSSSGCEATSSISGISTCG